MFAGKECTFTHWMLKGNAEASFFVVLKRKLHKLFLVHIPLSVVNLVIGSAFFA